jgi:hypothetical protein
MSDWSLHAARKFNDKQQREKTKDQIIRQQGPAQWNSLKEQFTAEIETFNKDSGNRRILELHDMNVSDGFMFTITVQDSERQLTLAYSLSGEISASGGGKFDESLKVSADWQTNSAFLVDSKQHPVNVADFVRRALESVLDIEHEA